MGRRTKLNSRFPLLWALCSSTRGSLLLLRLDVLSDKEKPKYHKFGVVELSKSLISTLVTAVSLLLNNRHFKLCRLIPRGSIGPAGGGALFIP